MLLHLAGNFLALDVADGDEGSKTKISFSFIKSRDDPDFFVSHSNFEDAEKDARTRLNKAWYDLGSESLSNKVNSFFEYCSSTNNLRVTVATLSRLEIHVSLFNPIASLYQGWVRLLSYCDYNASEAPIASRDISIVLYSCKLQCAKLLDLEKSRLKSCLSEVGPLVSQARELYIKLNGERT